jgi:hypothetical protein
MRETQRKDETNYKIERLWQKVLQWLKGERKIGFCLSGNRVTMYPCKRVLFGVVSFSVPRLLETSPKQTLNPVSLSLSLSLPSQQITVSSSPQIFTKENDKPHCRSNIAKTHEGTEKT